MKATITKPDGTKIEAEGTPEDLMKLAGQPQPAPCLLPHYPVYRTFPVYPAEAPFPGVWVQPQPCTCGRATGVCPQHPFGFGHGTVIVSEKSNPNLNAVCAAAPAMGTVWVGVLNPAGNAGAAPFGAVPKPLGPPGSLAQRVGATSH